MIREEINVLDGYELVKQEKKPRQIRTKSTSFSQIKKHFTDFRIRLLNKKLEREKDKAVTEGYKNPASERESEKMMKRASNIARLEEKIKILDGEKVPVDYVSKRAIKIKKAMMRNISYTSDNIYAVGLKKKYLIILKLQKLFQWTLKFKKKLLQKSERLWKKTLKKLLRKLLLQNQ